MMKKYTALPLILLSNFSFAESTADIVAPQEQQAITTTHTDNVLPLLSLEAQQHRAAELAKQAELEMQKEQEKRIAQEELLKAQQRIAQEIGTNSLLFSSEVAKLYLENNFSPLWTDKSAQKIFLKEYAVFAASGVSVKATKALQQILASEGLARDILLTDSFLDYLYYNKNVAQFANQWLYKLGSYTPKVPSNIDIEAWIIALRAGTSAQFIADLIPRNHIYQETVNSLFTMSPTDIPVNTKKSKNKKSKNDNLSEDSINSSLFHKLALNAQRLRIIPSFNNGIFVNIPSYQLYYLRDGKLALQSKVIVGRTDRKTPVMYSKLSNVVVNPPWNVPASIKNKDLVPKMRKDPSYVERRGYEIIDSKGNKVNPHSINWAAYDSPNKNFPYHIRQKAGDDSALGRYKFNMPSSDAIYLHDTPSRNLFGKSDRALSSGCVRVAKSDELATLLLKEAGWSEQRKQSVLSSKKTTSAQIRSDNPVYLYYVTAWVEDGKIHTLPDIYKFDTKISKSSLDWNQLKQLM